MQAYCTHTLQMGDAENLTHSPHEYLALVDLETYEPFISKDVDHLDMIAHLYAQMKALTAVAWGAPRKPLHLRIHLTDNDHIVEQLTMSPCDTTASGWIRTHGRICLTSHDRLYDCARHRTHRLLREQRRNKFARPQVLNVPPGVYSVFIRYHFPFPFGGGDQWTSPIEPKIHYTVILRHYPFPQPRLAPIRLPGLVPWAA